MNVIITDQNKVIIRPMIDIIASFAIDFKNEILSIIHNMKNDYYIMDFLYVNKIDSIGCGVISSIHRRLDSSGVCFEIVNVNEEVSRLFNTMRLNRMFNIQNYFKC